jgi:serine protease Do
MLAAVGVVAIGLLAGAGLYADAERAPKAADRAVVQQGQTYANTLSKAFREAADRVLPSVVMIRTSPEVAERRSSATPSPRPDGDGRMMPFEDLFREQPELRRFFREMPQMPMPGPEGGPDSGRTGIGSGVIIDASGVILTNNHVVDGGGRVMVRLMDGREFRATDVRTDPQSDLAIMRIEGATDLRAAKLGDSDAMQVGDWVLALGDPFGLEGTVTAGIISAKGRGLGMMARENFLQTDAAINPGNSGGPLVNLDGEVVGINTAIHSRSGGNQGVGFAVPASTAKWVSEQLLASGAVSRAYLGVVIQPMTHDLAEQFGVNARQGVLVTDVQKDSPAAKAGLQTGDIILDYAGKPVARPQELQSIVERTPIGEKETLTVLRDGQQKAIDVRPAALPGDEPQRRAGRSTPQRSSPSSFEQLGIDVETLTPEVAKQLGVEAERGVAITDVQAGSVAARAGLTAGAVITQANRKPVASIDDFRKAVEEQALDKGLLLLVRTGEGSRFVVLQVEK